MYETQQMCKGIEINVHVVNLYKAKLHSIYKTVLTGIPLIFLTYPNNIIVIIVRAQKANFGILGLQGEKLGLWDFTLFEIGILEIKLEIGILG